MVLTGEGDSTGEKVEVGKREKSLSRVRVNSRKSKCGKRGARDRASQGRGPTRQTSSGGQWARASAPRPTNQRAASPPSDLPPPKALTDSSTTPKERPVTRPHQVRSLQARPLTDTTHPLFHQVFRRFHNRTTFWPWKIDYLILRHFGDIITIMKLSNSETICQFN